MVRKEGMGPGVMGALTVTPGSVMGDAGRDGIDGARR